MSFDLQVWCARSMDLGPAFADQSGWKGADGFFNFEDASCFINAELQQLEAEEITELDEMQPGVDHSWLVDFNFSSKTDDYSPPSLERLFSAARSVAKLTRGVLEDPQSGEIIPT